MRRDAGKTILTYALNVYEFQEPQPAGYRDTVACYARSCADLL